MKTLYIECNSGIAGDMLVAALLELFENKADVVEKLQSYMPKNITLSATTVQKCGVAGTHFSVHVNGVEETICECEAVRDHHDEDETHSGCEKSREHHEHHDHHDERHGKSYSNVLSKIRALGLPESIEAKSCEAYARLAAAESEAHGVSVDKIHFHEVGDGDAIADVVCACALIDMLKADKIVVSPINTGKGTVKCAHGILPVPAPATASLLKGAPVFCSQGEATGELCTPTGAALAVSFADDFGDMPSMTISSFGYGFGTRELPFLNAVRVFLGESDTFDDEVSVISCNIDDMTGEAIAFAVDKLLGEGALDAYTQPIIMKKGRCAALLSCICETCDAQRFVELILKHTTTIGVRVVNARRYKLSRKTESVATEFGNVELKTSKGYGVIKRKYEYDDLARIARANDLSLSEVQARIDKSKE